MPSLLFAAWWMNYPKFLKPTFESIAVNDRREPIL